MYIQALFFTLLSFSLLLKIIFVLTASWIAHSFAEEEVVKKVRGLRTQYSREKLRLATRSKEGNPLKNKWIHYDSLAFIDEFLNTKGLKSIKTWNINLNEESPEIAEHLDEEDFSFEPSTLILAVSESIKNEIPDEIEDCVIVDTAQQHPFPINETPTQVKLQNFQKSLNQSTSQALNRKRPFQSLAKSPVQQNTPQPSISTIKETISALTNCNSSTTSSSSSRSLSAQATSTTRKDVQSPVSTTNEFQDNSKSPPNADEDEIFARYITTELRHIRDAHVKRIIKHKILNIIFEAHCSLHS